MVMTKTEQHRIVAQFHQAAVDAHRIADAEVDPEATKARLREEFPGWSIIHSTEGRWWALRNPLRDEAARRLVRFQVTDLDADSPDQLRDQLRGTVAE